MLRSICQYDYPSTLTAENKPANASCCVLSDLQMLIESITKETYLETAFYGKLLNAGIIRDDGYINSYDDALRLILMDREIVIQRPEIRAAIMSNMKRWKWFRVGIDNTPLPSIGFLKSRQHAVLIISQAVSESGKIDVQVIDPKLRGSKARYILPITDIKKIGTFA